MKTYLYVLISLLIMSTGVQLTSSTSGVPQEESYHLYKGSEPIPIKNIESGKWRIDDATLILEKVSESPFIMAPADGRSSDNYEVVRPKNTFQVIWLKMQNNGKTEISVFTLFQKSCILVDEAGKTHHLSKQMKKTGTSFPLVQPGGERRFFVAYDVPKGTVPASLKIEVIKSIIELKIE
jgi:hypothetical protein